MKTDIPSKNNKIRHRKPGLTIRHDIALEELYEYRTWIKSIMNDSMWKVVDIHSNIDCVCEGEHGGI